jgi:hypothetical protein
MNNKLKTYYVSFHTYQLSRHHYRDMYDTMAKHWINCGGDISLSFMNQPYPFIWQGNDYILTQFKLTQPNYNIIEFSEQIPR